MKKKKALIITHSQDNECVDMVTNSLRSSQAEVYRFDTDLFPNEVGLSMMDSEKESRIVLSTVQGEVDIHQLDSVWYRRMAVAKMLPSDMDPRLRRPSIQESHTVVTGLMSVLPCFVMDDYHKIRLADHKQLQLAVARRVGLEIPRTLTSNEPEKVKAFFNTCSTGMVAKMQSSFAVDIEGKENVVFTNKITEHDLDDLDGLAFCPMTFQELVPKKVELRVTIVGNRIFSASIDSQSNSKAAFDWRRDGNGMIAQWQEYPLPQDIQEKLLDLMKHLNLNYGAIDLIVTPENQFVFLEINPGGEFFWLQSNPPYFPISSAIAEVLLKDR